MKTTHSLLLAATAALALTLPALSQDKSGSNITAGAKAEPGSTATQVLAQELFAIGKADGDAVTVLAAAKLAAESQPEAGGEITKSTGGDRAETAAEGAPPATATQMFDLALQLAGDDEALKGLIEDARAETGRGAAGGAKYWESYLPAGRWDRYDITFNGNQFAEVGIAGDGSADLDMEVYDENGNLVCSDYSFGDVAYCDWSPIWTGNFTVAVLNNGSRGNYYWLLTN